MPRKSFDIAGAYVSVKDLLGETVLFMPTQYVEEIATSFGDKDAVVADIVVLSDSNAEHYDVMIFQGAIIGRLKRNIGNGRPVLGVIAKGEAKKGQQAPYLLDEPDEQGVAAAEAYLDANPDFTQVKVTTGEAYKPYGDAARATDTGQVDFNKGNSAANGSFAASAAPFAASVLEDPFAADPF